MTEKYVIPARRTGGQSAQVRHASLGDNPRESKQQQSPSASASAAALKHRAAYQERLLTDPAAELAWAVWNPAEHSSIHDWLDAEKPSEIRETDGVAWLYVRREPRLASLLLRKRMLDGPRSRTAAEPKTDENNKLDVAATVTGAGSASAPEGAGPTATASTARELKEARVSTHQDKWVEVKARQVAAGRERLDVLLKALSRRGTVPDQVKRVLVAAVESRQTSGKWMIMPPRHAVDAAWTST